MFQHFKRNVENIMGAFIQWDSLLSMARSLFFSFYYWWTMPSGLKAEDVISLWSWLCQEWKKFPFLHSWQSHLHKEITSSAFIYYLCLRCHSNKQIESCKSIKNHFVVERGTKGEKGKRKGTKMMSENWCKSIKTNCSKFQRGRWCWAWRRNGG